MKAGTIIAIVIAVAVIGGIIGYSEYQRKPAGAGSMEPQHSVTAEQLLIEFKEDESAATTKYVGEAEQVTEVTGTIASMGEEAAGKRNITLETGDPLAGVVCEFAVADLPATWKEGDQVTLRGFCTGMLMDVILQRCVAVE